MVDILLALYRRKGSAPPRIVLAFFLLCIAPPTQAMLSSEIEAAERMIRRGDGIGAQRLLESALRAARKNDLDRAAAMLALAGLHDDAERSRQLFEEVARDYPHTAESARARIELARYRFAMGAYWGTLEDLEELFEEEPYFPGKATTYHLLGSVELALDRPTRAATAFRDGLAANPSKLDRAWLWIGLGDARAADGRLEEAADAYRRAIDAPPAAAPVARFALAEIEAQRGDRALAAQLYEQVAEQSPGHYAEARRALADLKRKDGGGRAIDEDPPVQHPARQSPIDPTLPDRPTAEATTDSSSDSGPDEVVDPAPPPAIGNWAVQVGAFTEIAKATALRASVQEGGHDVELTTGSVGGKPFYRVLVGAYADRNEAYAAGLDLSDELGLADFLPVERHRE
ncbi:MAG: hypothetical protein CME06_08915 [Gemmatimonadetes bacterium]|nr:hypothetical protein [Gemmatimonadota bacterium]